MRVRTAVDLIYGINPVEALLNSSPERILRIFVEMDRNNKRSTAIIHTACSMGLSISPVQRKKMDTWVMTRNHQGIIAECRRLPSLGEADLARLVNHARSPLILVLDRVTDPHNLGACLRSAAAAGATAVLVPTARSAPLTPIASKAASGGDQVIPIVSVPNLVRALDHLKELGLWIIGLDSQAKTPIYSLDLTTPGVIVVGSEGSGLRLLTRRKCDYLSSIPMQNGMDSLNVSVTAGICLFESVRQRNSKK